MENLEGMVPKFTVFKTEDIEKLEHHEKVLLGHIAELIGEQRAAEGKAKYNAYLVINTDEPYAPEVVEILKRHGHWGDPAEEETP